MFAGYQIARTVYTRIKNLLNIILTLLLSQKFIEF